MTSTEVARREISAGQLDTIRNTVAQGATDAELAMFLELANRYQLDPFAREIWCVNMGGKGMTVMASRDGYLAIANRHPAFDGIEADVVRMGDTFQRKAGVVDHSYGAERGAILGAYALVHRTDRSRPAYFFAPFDEYDRKSGAWKTNPSAMIVKVAESMALKRAFAISGLVTQEEGAHDWNAGEVLSAPKGPDVDDLAMALIATAGDAQELGKALKAHGISRGDLVDPEVLAEARRIADEVAAVIPGQEEMFDSPRQDDAA